MQVIIRAASRLGGTRQILILVGWQRSGGFGAQAGVGFLHLDHLVAVERHEGDAAGRLAVDPIFDLQPILGFAATYSRGGPAPAAPGPDPCPRVARFSLIACWTSGGSVSV